jgi:acetyltransferase-like isoleucine patch superfamily enzyme
MILEVGKGSTAELADSVRHHPKGRIQLIGEGNRLTIGEPLALDNIDIQLSGRAELHIGPGCVIGNLCAFAQAGAVIRIGGATGFVGYVKVMAHETGNITVGETCLFAEGTVVTASDMHSIIDDSTGQRINPARDIAIHDHVWVGMRTMILKGAQIGKGSIVGAGAVVTGELPPNTLCVGVPARAVRHGVSWRHSLT